MPQLDAAAAERAGLSAQEVADGTSIYLTKCSQCHKFYNPARYKDDEWRSWMKKMSRKAKLTPDQENTVRRYLDAFRLEAKSAPQG